MARALTFGHQEPFRDGFMTAGCHLGPLSWRNGSSGMAACGGGGTRQGWSFLGLLHPRPSGLLPPSPFPEPSDSGGREHTRLCQAGCPPSPGELDGITGAPALVVEASRLGRREATRGPARRSSFEGEVSPREKSHRAGGVLRMCVLCMSSLSPACPWPQPGG